MEKPRRFPSLISGGKLYLAGNFKGEEVGILTIDTGNWLRPRGAALLKALVSNKKHSLTFYSPCLRIVSTYFFFSLFLSFSFYRHIPFPRFPTCEQQREFDRIAISEFVQSNYTLFFYASMSLSILIRQVLSFFFIVRVRTCGWIDKRREAEVWSKINNISWRIYFLKNCFEILDFMNMVIIFLPASWFIVRSV